MADYLPKWDNDDNVFITTGAGTVTGGQLVDAATGLPTTSAVASWYGTAAFDSATGDTLTLFVDGVQTLTSSGAITKGLPVVSAASGRVAAYQSGTNDASLIVGIALAATTGASQSVLVKMAR
jgi:hypothetical protein